MKNDISFDILIQTIKKIENIEKYIAQKNGKMGFHSRKWTKVGNGTNVNAVDPEIFAREYLENLESRERL